MSFHQALQAFAAAVTAKTGLLPGGGPEEQLRGPFENFIAAAGAALGRELVCAGEAPPVIDRRDRRGVVRDFGCLPFGRH